MKYLEVVGRCLGLLLALALAMPAETSASFVTGGELPDCAHTEIEPVDCASNSGYLCDSNKNQCVGCGEGRKSFIGEDGSSACNYSTVACKGSQKNCEDSGDSCTGQDCP